MKALTIPAALPVVEEVLGVVAVVGGSVSSFDPKQTGDGHVAPKSERIEYYNQLAKEYGLNAQAILMTIDKEGLHKLRRG